MDCNHGSVTSNRDVERVARDHLAAVESGEPALMAADYAPQATLRRGGETYEGRRAIAAYFRTVPARLGDARVVFDRLDVDGDTATFWWHLEGADASGRDVVVIRDGAIVSQVVHLDDTDF